MKKIIYFLAILFTLDVSAQRVTIDNVPEEISKAFKTKYSIAEEVNWAVSDENYEADFKVSKADFTATFNRAGKWLKTEKFIKSSELPKEVRDAVTKEFGQLSGYSYENVEWVETEKNAVYEIDIKKGELAYKMVVTEKGEILKLDEMEDEKED